VCGALADTQSGDWLIDEAFPEVFVRKVMSKCKGHCRDDTPGSDTWAVSNGWTSVTPLSLRQDIIFGVSIVITIFNVQCTI
jgi:hypothetical protein